ncbi:MAG: hypothetical protein AAGG09_11700 [Pseudomonadota bacterium]
MAYDPHLLRARRCLRAAQADLRAELSAYPTPVSGCDAQYNHLIGMRTAIGTALATLDGPAFVATPRRPSPDAGVESR